MLKRDIDFKKMAEDLFRGIPVDTVAYGVVFRKGKTNADVVAARTKAVTPKYGHAKIEFELSSLALFLAGIFKAVPVPTKGLKS